MESRKILSAQISLILFSLMVGAILLFVFPSAITKSSYFIFILIQLTILFLAVSLVFLFKNLTRELLIWHEEKKLLPFIAEQTRKLTSHLGKDKIFRSMLEFCTNTIKCEIGFLLTYDYKTDTFNYEAGHNMDQTMLTSTKFAPRKGVILEMSQNKEIIFIDDVQTVEKSGQGWMLPKRASHIKISQKFVALPLIVEGKLTGIIGLYCPKESDVFIEHNPHLLNIMREQLSIALASAIQSEYANLDRLTMLYDHEYFQRRLEEEIWRCKRYRSDISLLMIDVDHFKFINDTYGHQIGDVVLKRLAEIIKSNVRIVDFCARYGGEEFAVLLPETNIKGAVAASERLQRIIAEGERMITETSGAVAAAEHLRKTVEQYPFRTDGTQIKVTVSIGVADWKYKRDIDKGSEHLIKQADEQLYRAKNTGRNRVCYLEAP